MHNVLKIIRVLKKLSVLKTDSKFFISCVFLSQFLTPLNTLADTLNIAVASNFRPALEQLRDTFIDRQNSTSSEFDYVEPQIIISSASSGVLYAQILRGAPFQLFFSANTTYPEKLVASGYGVANTLSTYAIGKVVLMSRYESDGLNGKSPKEILTKAKRIAIANPRSAPYGIAAMEALENLGVAKESQKKLVMGNNIAQAWQFFHSRNADVVIVAESLVYYSMKEQQQGVVTIDLSSYLKHPVRQGLVAIKPVLPLAQEFLDFMTTSVAEKIITEAGYLLPRPTDIKSSMNGIITPAIMTP